MASMANQSNKASVSGENSDVAVEEDISVRVFDDDTLAVPNQYNFAGTINIMQMNSKSLSCCSALLFSISRR